MGRFSAGIQIGSPSGERWKWVQALVDTGATYTWVPRSLLDELGLTPSRRFPFILTDGRRIERDMVEARARYNGVECTTLIVAGDEGTQPLLGAYTLEGLGLAADPVNRRLIEVPGLLM